MTHPAIPEVCPPGEGVLFRVKGDAASRVLTDSAVVCRLTWAFVFLRLGR